MNGLYDFLVGGSVPGLLSLAAICCFVAFLCVFVPILVLLGSEESCDCPRTRLESQSRDFYLLKTFHRAGCQRHTSI